MLISKLDGAGEFPQGVGAASQPKSGLHPRCGLAPPGILNLSCRHDPTSSFLEIGFQAFDGDGIPEGIVLHHANWIAQISKLIKLIWNCQSDRILFGSPPLRSATTLQIQAMNWQPDNGD